MSLSSALFTGLSGLEVNQTRLGVVGNNIANVNTVAFKSSRALFKPQFYVTDSGGTPPGGDFGGTNPSQRGLGAVVASVEKNFAAGSIEPTGKPTDLAVDGDGFFVVQGEGQRFTRDGSFSLNSANQLVTTSGEFVQGYAADDDGNVAVGELTNVEIPLGMTDSASATTRVSLQGNLNADGPVGTGASVLSSQLITTAAATPPAGTTALVDLRATDSGATLFAAGDVLTLAGEKAGRTLDGSELTVTAATTVDELRTYFSGGLGIDETVAVPGAPAPGVTLEADAVDPSSARLFVVGNVGLENALSLGGAALTSSGGTTPLLFAGATNAAGFQDGPAGESVHTSFVGYDSLGTPVSVDVTAVLEAKTDTGNTWRFYVNSGDDTDPSLVAGNGTLTFGTDGRLLDSTGTTISIDRAATGADTPLGVELNFDAMTSLTSRASELVMTEQDGAPLGVLQSFSVGADGTVTGAFSNGRTKALAQVAMATFDNPQGLIDAGGNQFTAGANSGVPIVGAPLAFGAGAVRSGALELSNVDLSEEFINLIISSTGFSASSRVITTSDQLLTELLNSTR
ncbi:MAG: Flagellar hook protein FlgE [uncultured Phycisphaerae bacterium]|uniref:Flagellar hook protein FlgE n=1 Tax=uncultured Phycisphaerae bacterium TaxID=904963 RepID=A0A6J4NPU9_9BACT|nr:MAG: Flagellar hook protein FlgE [uncultured Phycisphaerae bacterium]